MSLQAQILEKLSDLQAAHIDIVNESDMHSGPPGRESHFRLLIVSDQFTSLNRIQRQQLVYQKLDFAFKAGLHALSLKTLSPSEWSGSDVANFTSPDCAHKKA